MVGNQSSVSSAYVWLHGLMDLVGSQPLGRRRLRQCPAVRGHGQGLYAIDHIAVPSVATVKSAERLPMAGEGRALSDHDAYVVDFVLPHRWSVYVIDVLGLGPNHVYVGQSWYPPEERRRQHAGGVRAARVFKRDGVTVGHLRPDLLPSLPRLTTEAAALETERTVAEDLRGQGFIVHGGH